LSIDYGNYEVNAPVTISLNEDGTITGDCKGTWSLDEGTPYIDLTIDGVVYSGVTLEMNVEGSSIKNMTFTALGDTNQITVWGSRSLE
jgi:beta-xylosidase